LGGPEWKDFESEWRGIIWDGLLIMKRGLAALLGHKRAHGFPHGKSPFRGILSGDLRIQLRGPVTFNFGDCWDGKGSKMILSDAHRTLPKLVSKSVAKFVLCKLLGNWDLANP